MAQRRKKGRPINGWIILDKDYDVGSTEAVSKLKWLFQAQKAGHAGTLDPLATGVLPIALGEATKTVAFAMDGAKRYRFTVRWGVETDTDDAEGRAVAASERRPTDAEIATALGRYVGRVMQVPPRYSAIKIGGERAYDLARDGEIASLEPREVAIERLTLEARPDRDHASFDCACGKGTYVRALARDLGRDLGCLGHVTALRRTRVGPFDEAGAVSIEVVRAAREDPDGGRALLRPIETALDRLPQVRIDRTAAERVRRGQAVLLRGRDAPILDGEAYATAFGDLVAIGEVTQGAFRPVRVFIGQA